MEVGETTGQYGGKWNSSMEVGETTGQYGGKWNSSMEVDDGPIRCKRGMEGR